jgi:hypothetical protein
VTRLLRHLQSKRSVFSFTRIWNLHCSFMWSMC